MADKYKVDKEWVTRFRRLPNGCSTFGKWTVKDFVKLYPEIAEELDLKSKAKKTKKKKAE